MKRHEFPIFTVLTVGLKSNTSKKHETKTLTSKKNINSAVFYYHHLYPTISSFSNSNS